MKKLNKYTTLPILLYYLTENKVPLLDPENWEDKNDTCAIRSYMKRKCIKKLLATCFSSSSETIHHWNTYADEISGCCIEFNSSLVTTIINSDLRHGPVDYLKIAQLSSVLPDKIPFSKRYPYRIEKEYRVFYEGAKKNYSLSFSLEQINKITFSQKMPAPVFEIIKKRLKAELPSETLVTHSTIISNPLWIDKIAVC